MSGWWFAQIRVKDNIAAMEQLGAFIRKKREELLKCDRSFSQLQISKKIGIEQSYLSKIERGVATKLSEEKILALAELLREDPDYLLALGGKVSSDVLNIIQKRPRIFARLVRDMKNMPEDVIEADHDFKQRQSRISHLYNLAMIGFFHFEEDPEHSAWSKLTPEILLLPQGALPSMESLKGALSSPSLKLFSSLEKESSLELKPYECELQLQSVEKGPRYIKIWGDSERPFGSNSLVRLGLIQDVTREVLSREELKQAHLALSGTVENQTEQLSLGIRKLKKEIAKRKLLEAELREVNLDISRQKEIQKMYLKESAYALRSLINKLAIESEDKNDSSSSILSHISAAINNMNDFFEIESGLSAQMDDIEPRSFFQSLISDIQKESKSCLSLELSPDLPPTVVVDHQRLQQIVHPIAAYLMQDTPWGSILLTVDYLSDTGLLILTFSSTKITSSLSKEFFYPATRHKQKGVPSWMLATVGPIVEGLGGNLFVDRTPSGGAIVSIKLPSASHDLSEASPSGKQPLLVVEDDEYSRLYLERSITKLGFEVESVALGQNALDKVYQRKYGTILLDIQLPDIDGTMVAKSIRKEDCLNSTTRIIAVTAHATPEDRRIYNKCGINQFIAKPYKIESLVKILQRESP